MDINSCYNLFINTFFVYIWNLFYFNTFFYALGILLRSIYTLKLRS